MNLMRVAKPPQYGNWPAQADRLLRTLHEDDETSADWKGTPKSIDEFKAASPATLAQGELLSETDCALCHVRPQPDALPKVAWANWLRDKYGLLSGWQVIPKALHRSLAEKNGAPPPSLKNRPEYLAAITSISRTDYAKIAAYYLHEAPLQPLPQPASAPLSNIPAPFVSQLAEKNAAHAVTQYGSGRIDEKRHTLILGNVGGHQLEVYDTKGNLERGIALGGAPSDIRPEGDDLIVTLMGEDFSPVNTANGSVVRVKNYNGWLKPGKEVLFEHLRRPVLSLEADFKLASRAQWVISEFGFREGRLSMFDDEHRQKTELLQVPGALAATAVDFDEDGSLDLLALVAQEQESLFYFHNTGHGTFEPAVRLFQYAPTYGFNSLRMADIDGDGRIDAVTTNGDNMDLDIAPLKAYHGIRVFRNLDGKALSEAFFFPLYGAAGSVVRDFDGDGDPDIVAISFWPVAGAKRKTVVYLENLGHFQFREHPMPATLQSTPWIGLTAGDLDGDGDPDLLFFTMLSPGNAPKWSLLKNLSHP